LAWRAATSTAAAAASPPPSPPPSPAAAAPRPMLYAIVPLKSTGSWLTSPICERSHRTDSERTSAPSSTTRPPSTSYHRSSSATRVDFPHPDGPASATVAPGSIVSERPWYTCTSRRAGYAKLTSTSSIRPAARPDGGTAPVPARASMADGVETSLYTRRAACMASARSETSRETVAKPKAMKMRTRRQLMMSEKLIKSASKKSAPTTYWKAAAKRIVPAAVPLPTPRATPTDGSHACALRPIARRRVARDELAPLRTSCLYGSDSSAVKASTARASSPKAAMVRSCSSVSEATDAARTREALARSAYLPTTLAWTATGSTMAGMTPKMQRVRRQEASKEM